jgi:hypothetical protein
MEPTKKAPTKQSNPTSGRRNWIEDDANLDMAKIIE